MSIVIKKLFFFFSVCFYITIFLPNNSNANDNLFQELAQAYGLKPCGQREINDDTIVCEDKDDNEYFYSELETLCNESKKKATECCQDPSACSNVMAEIGKGALTIAPVILSVFEQSKTSKEIKKNKDLTDQEKSDKLCSSKNKVAMGKFSSNLIGQFMPLFEKDCADKIKQCKKKCDAAVKAFQQDLRKAITNGKNTQIKSTIQNAKACLHSNDESVPFDEILFERFNENSKNFFTVGKNKFKIKNLDNCTKLYSQVLFYTKAYYNTMKNKKDRFAFNETEIIDCSKIKDRVVGKNNKAAAQPITPPMIELCKNIQNNLYKENPTSPVPDSSVTVPGSGINVGSLLGDKPNPRHPLLLPEGPKNNEDDKIKIPDPLLQVKNKPSLSKNPPKFKGASASSNSPGGGVGSTGGASGGGSGGSPYEDGEYYEEDYSDPGAFGGGFPRGGYADSGFPTESGGMGYDWGDRELAGDEEEDDDEGYDDNGDNDFTSSESGKSIFDIASKNIQYFCTNLKCSP